MIDGKDKVMVPDDDMKELRNELRGQLPIDEIKEYANQRSALMYSIVLIGVFFIVIAISFLLDRLG